MRRVSMKAILGTVALGALVGGCATTVEMGPGYYHYDVGVARASAPPPAVVVQEPAVVYREPTVVYREPTVVYRDSAAVVYQEPALIYYRSARYGVPYNEHGQ